MTHNADHRWHSVRQAGRRYGYCTSFFVTFLRRRSTSAGRGGRALKLDGDDVEDRLQRSAQRRQGDDRGHGNERRDQAVFDSRRTGLVGQKGGELLVHLNRLPMSG